MGDVNTSQQLMHRSLGPCELLRIEGIHWVVKQISTGHMYHMLASRRNEFLPVSENLHQPSIKADVALLQPHNPISAPTFVGTTEHLSSTAAAPINIPPSDNDTLSTADLCTLVAWNSERRFFSFMDTQFLCSILSKMRSNVTLSNEKVARAQNLLQAAIRGGLIFDHERSRDPVKVSIPPQKVEPADEIPHATPSLSGIQELPRVSSPIPTPVMDTRAFDETDPRELRRIIHALKNGLPPICSRSRNLAVGIDHVQQFAENFLDAVDRQSGAAIDIRGAYGQGKTFTLQIVEEMAFEAGYLVARTEVDASENRLDKPANIYRALLRNLRIPRDGHQGAQGLVDLVDKALRHLENRELDMFHLAEKRKLFLLEHLQCEQLSWLFSDPEIAYKQRLIHLLAGEPIGPISHARQEHILNGKGCDWPPFLYGTQGDVASYLFSGLGLLARMLHFKGFILILDEMEKWQELDWKAQSRAGNLLGGLIWAATAAEHHRKCRTTFHTYKGIASKGTCDHSSELQHSAQCGGSPFTTQKPCHLGLAIAMTPRGDNDPETGWREYGKLQVVNLPEFNLDTFRQYYAKVVTIFKRAYTIAQDIPQDVFSIAKRRWHESATRTARSAVTSVIESLCEWKDQNDSTEGW